MNHSTNNPNKSQENQECGLIQHYPHDKEHPFTMISNALIRDEKLSPNCRWMLIYLLSNKPGWKISPKQIHNHVNKHRYCGRNMVYKWINEACEFGYMKKEEYKVGNLIRYKWYVSEFAVFRDSVAREPETRDHKNNYKKEKLKKDRDTKVSLMSQVASDLSTHMILSIQKLNPDFKKPNEKVWIADMDKLIRIDKRDPEEVKQVIDWVREDDFWKTNVLSPLKLRKQYDMLVLKMQTEEPKKKNGALKSTNTTVALAFKKEIPWLEVTAYEIKNKNLKEALSLTLPTCAIIEALENWFNLYYDPEDGKVKSRY